jgi:tetratricopeptide (TPR) repeat protein
MRLTFIFIFSFLVIVQAFSQQNDLYLADEYFSQGEYDKAYTKYRDLSSKNQNIPLIYQNYLVSLKNLSKLDEAQKFVNRTIKIYPDNPIYKLDLYFLMKEQQDNKAEKYFNSIVQSIRTNPLYVEHAQEHLLNNGEVQETIDLLLAARAVSSSKSDYAMQLARAYLILDKKDLMVEEMLDYLRHNPSQLEFVKNNFQNTLEKKEEFDLLENRLYELVQKNPDNIVFNELLLWINIQDKNFKQAFLQARAIDKKGKLNGAKLNEVGKIALDNKDYDAAITFYQYVNDEIKTGPYYSIARRMMIYSKEEAVKNTYPVDKQKITSLIQDYKKLIQDFGRINQSFEATRSMALLYGLYLDKKDTAIVLLQSILKEPAADIKLKSNAKISLADIYLLNQEPWEASLLYSQVEKDMKEDQIGHDAKLKNAKLAYYTGEFELAQSHLDILKMATTREIANDAMELSILIQDNTALDTSYDAMQEYAAIDLLLLQNEQEEALNRLNTMLINFPDHSLTDDIYWLQAKIYRKKASYEEVIKKLDKILTEFKQGILGDDAMFTKALILDENLDRKEEAMDIYKEFMFVYPGSIYVAEARTRYRQLRGDKL